MSAIPFDTHRFFNELRQAGVSEQQAEVFTRLQQETITATITQTRQEYHLDELATKQDIDIRIREVEAKIRESELKLEAKIAETKAELIRWVIGAGFLQTALIIGVVMRAAHLI